MADNDKSYNVVTGTEKADTIHNNNHNAVCVTINARGGNDYIRTLTDHSLIDGGAGNDTIYNFFDTEWLIDGGSSPVGGQYTTILGGTGNDSIKNHSENVSVDGGDDDDILINSAKNTTLNGGKGNDTIEVNDRVGTHPGNIVQYSAGGGNDVLLNFSNNKDQADTIQLVGVSITGGYRGTGSNDRDVILEVSDGTNDGTITIKKGVGRVLNVLTGDPEEFEAEALDDPLIVNNTVTGEEIVGGVLNDNIRNSGSNAYINAGGGADYVYNSGDGSEIVGGAGNDTLYNSGDNAVLDGGADNDYINNSGTDVSLNGGAGDDAIENSGDGSTIVAGKGNDTITLNAGSLIQYANGDGNDVIYGYDETSTIQITSGSPKVGAVGLDVVITVSSGTITLKDAIGKTVNYINASGKLTSKKYGSFNIENADDFNTVEGTSGADKIYNSGDFAVIDGGAGTDTIKNEGGYVSIAGSSDNDSINDLSWGSTTVRGGTGDDTIEFANDANHVIEYGTGDGNDVIIGYGESDSIKLTKGSIGRSTVVGNDVIFTIGGGTLTLKDASDKLITFINAKDSIISSTRYGAANIDNSREKASLAGTSYDDLIKNWADEATIRAGAGNDTIENYGASVKIYGDADEDIITNYADNVTIDGGAAEDYIDNSGAGVSVNGGDGNDYIINSERRATLDGGKGDDYIEGSEYADVYFFNAGEGNDVITNFDNNDMLKIGKGSITASVVSDGNLTVTVKSGSSIGTVMLQDVGNREFTVSDDGKALYATRAIPVIELLNIEDSRRFNPEEQEESEAGAKYYIYNVGENVTIVSGSNDDTIEASEDSDEMFEFGASDGNDVIVNFGKNDTLHVVGGSITNSVISDNGTDVVLTISDGISNGTVTLKDAAEMQFRKSGKSGNQYFMSSAPNTITGKKDNYKIPGTEYDDIITNTGNNVTIEGKGGNDTIIGSVAYGELIRYSAADGNDVITNFNGNDTIQITNGEIQAHSKVGNDYVFNIRGGIYSGSITIKDASDSSFKIENGFITKQISTPIVNRDDAKDVNGTTGDDLIYNSGENVTIRPGKGNDTINGSTNGEVVAIAYNNGNNIFTNFGVNDSIKMTSGKTMTYATVEDDVIVTVASGSTKSTVVLKNAAAKVAEYGASIKDSVFAIDRINIIDNSDNNVSLTGWNGSDSIVNTGANVTITPGKGNDTITGSDSDGELFRFSYTGDNNLITNFRENDTLVATSGTISTQTSGDDVIVSITKSNTTATVTLQGAADCNLTLNKSTLAGSPVSTIEVTVDGQSAAGTGGRDYIINPGFERVTIRPNGGNDTIESSDPAEYFVINAANGNNLITEFRAGDTLRTDSSSMATAVSGDDVIVTINNSGTVTLGGAANPDNYVNLVKSGKYIYAKSKIVTLENDKDNIVVNGTNTVDVIVNSGNNVTINGKSGDDTIYGSDLYGDLFRFNFSSGDNVVMNFGEGDDSIYIPNGSVTTTKSGDDYTVTIKQSKYTSTVLLKDVSSNTTLVQSGKYITIDHGIISTVINDDSVNVSGTDALELFHVAGQNVTIDGNGGDDTIVSGESLNGTYLFDAIDGNDVIVDFGDEDVVRLMSGTLKSAKASGKDFVITATQTLPGETLTGTMTIKENTKIGQQGSYFTKTGVVKNIINRKDNVKINGTVFDDYIINTGANVTINGKGGNDTIVGSSNGEVFQFAADGGKDYITDFGDEDTLQVISGKIESRTATKNGDVIVDISNGSFKGTVTLGGAAGYVFNEVKDQDNGVTYLTVDSKKYIVNRDDDKLVTGSGSKEYIINSGENATIRPGKGNDTMEGSIFGELYQFAYSYGNNVITNFGANDSLQITSGTATTQKSGDDVIVTITKGSTSSKVTLKGAANYTLKKSGSYWYVSSVKHYDNADNGVTLTGSSKDDVLTNTGENVTITPGKGNDTMIGSDEFGDFFRFAYSYGDDVIMNFGKDDTLRVTSGSITSMEQVDNDVIVSVSKGNTVGTVTLKDAGLLGNEGYTLVKNGSYVTLDSVNEIVNDYDNVKVKGTSKRDYIINTAANATIEAGKGNDTIDGSVFAETYRFAYNSGANVITNFGVEDTLNASSGDLTYKKSGKNMIVTIASGTTKSTVTLQGAGSCNFTKSGNNLFVKNINKITNDDDNVKVTTSKGDDYVVNTGENVTIQGSAGNDTFTGSDGYAETYAFAYSYGSNVIKNFGSGDVITMTSGSSISYTTSGDDYVVSITKSKTTATVTLEGAADVGKLQKSTNGEGLMMRDTNTSVIILSEAPANEDDYWFINDDSASTDVNEIDSMLNDALDDNAVAQLGAANDFSLGSARKDEFISAVMARHQSKK